jgi:glycine hydroxymethyltransferase
MVPFDERSPFITSGIRLGTAALTTKGMKEDEMRQIADFIDLVLSNPESEKVHQDVSSKIMELNKDFQIY